MGDSQDRECKRVFAALNSTMMLCSPVWRVQMLCPQNGSVTWLRSIVCLRFMLQQRYICVRYAALWPTSRLLALSSFLTSALTDLPCFKRVSTTLLPTPPVAPTFVCKQIMHGIAQNHLCTRRHSVAVLLVFKTSHTNLETVCTCYKDNTAAAQFINLHFA